MNICFLKLSPTTHQRLSGIVSKILPRGKQGCKYLQLMTNRKKSKKETPPLRSIRTFSTARHLFYMLFLDIYLLIFD
jgi:hypothetical protein